MLTVWCVSVGGKYNDYFVQRLQREVGKYLTLPHRFVCIADHAIDQVLTIPPLNDLRGWWQKINLFAPNMATEQNLYIDLDTVITGSLDDLVERYGGCTLAAANNWAQSGHNSVQSSVMVWRGSDETLPIWRDFDHDWAVWPPRNDGSVPYWGDQEWITALRAAGTIKHTPIYPPWIRSYKYHIRPTHRLPADVRCVIFHGSPDPDCEQVRRIETWYQW